MSKVWFITGASSGIGAAVVNAALEAGDRVVATARNMAKLRSAIDRPESDRLAFVPLDVMQAVLPVMRRQRSGHNVSSIAGVIGYATARRSASARAPIHIDRR